MGGTVAAAPRCFIWTTYETFPSGHFLGPTPSANKLKKKKKNRPRLSACIFTQKAIPGAIC